MPTPNYSQAYRNYMTNSAGYALPSSVRTYSVFDPSSNSWKRMSSDVSSPLPSSPVQGQQSIADALAQARQTQGAVYPAQGMTPTQTPGVFLRPRDQGQIPAQTPPEGPRMASGGRSGGGMGVPSSQPSASPRGASMSPADAVAFGAAMQNPGANLQAQPRVFMPLESQYERFQQEIPRSTAYGPLQNPRTVRSMSPDYQEASAAPVAAQPTPAAPAQTARAVGYPTTDIFGDEVYWRSKAHRFGENDSYWNEKKRHIGQLIDATAHATPVLAPFGYAGAVTRGLIAPRGLATYGVNIPIEPLAKATRTAQTAAVRSRLTPDAQRIADSLRFITTH